MFFSFMCNFLHGFHHFLQNFLNFFFHYTNFTTMTPAHDGFNVIHFIFGFLLFGFSVSIFQRIGIERERERETVKTPKEINDVTNSYLYYMFEWEKFLKREHPMC